MVLRARADLHLALRGDSGLLLRHLHLVQLCAQHLQRQLLVFELRPLLFTAGGVKRRCSQLLVFELRPLLRHAGREEDTPRGAREGREEPRGAERSPRGAREGREEPRGAREEPRGAEGSRGEPRGGGEEPRGGRDCPRLSERRSCVTKRRMPVGLCVRSIAVST